MTDLELGDLFETLRSNDAIVNATSPDEITESLVPQLISENSTLTLSQDQINLFIGDLKTCVRYKLLEAQVNNSQTPPE
jgi:hypothetical protein